MTNYNYYFPSKEAFDKIEGKRGIVFFQNYWGPGNQGDHIDLWNGSRLTDWSSWVRIHSRLGASVLHAFADLSDYTKSQSVWFWPVFEPVG